MLTAIDAAVFEQRSCGNGVKGPRYADGRCSPAGPGGAPADPPPPGPGKEPLHVYCAMPPNLRDSDFLLTIAGRWQSIAFRRERRLRLGSTRHPWDALNRPRPDRSRSAQGHRHPVFLSAPSFSCLPAICSGQPPRPQLLAVTDAHLRSPPDTRRSPPPRVARRRYPPIALPPAIPACSSDPAVEASDHRAALPSTPLVSMRTHRLLPPPTTASPSAWPPETSPERRLRLFPAR